MSILTDRVEARYKILGMTQKEFLDKADLTSAAWSKWKNELNTPSVKSLKKVSDTIHIPISELLALRNGEDPEEKEKPIVHKSAARQKLDALVDKMNDEQIMRLIEMIEAAKQL